MSTELYKNSKTNKYIYPWVFWIRFSICSRMSSAFWYSRGANVIDIQLYKLRMSIGLPWLQTVLSYYANNSINKSFEHLKTTNDSYVKWYHIHIGTYKTANY
jgi:hypothetical protein